MINVFELNHCNQLLPWHGHAMVELPCTCRDEFVLFPNSRLCDVERRRMSAAVAPSKSSHKEPSPLRRVAWRVLSGGVMRLWSASHRGP